VGERVESVQGGEQQRRQERDVHRNYNKRSVHGQRRKDGEQDG
jgi:hypothetical protein